MLTILSIRRKVSFCGNYYQAYNNLLYRYNNAMRSYQESGPMPSLTRLFLLLLASKAHTLTVSLSDSSPCSE